MTSDFPMTPEMLDLILQVTRITSEPLRQALHDHFVLNLPQSEAAQRYGVAKQQLGPQVRHIRTHLKPVFDEYAQLVMKAAAKPGKSKP